MKQWDVQLAEHAEHDLREIYEYIAFNLFAPDTAGNLIHRQKTRIQGLDFMPLRHAAYPNEPWNSRGLRRVDEGNFAVFYIPSEANHVVTVIRIMYSGMDINQILGAMLFEDTAET